MADTKISALPAAGSAATANEFPINEAGTTKKVTLAQTITLMKTVLAPYVPAVVANGVTFSVIDNTQVVHANQIVVNAGGQILVTGTGALIYVN